MFIGKAYQGFNWFRLQLLYLQALDNNYILILFGNFFVKIESSLGHLCTFMEFVF